MFSFEYQEIRGRLVPTRFVDGQSACFTNAILDQREQDTNNGGVILWFSNGFALCVEQLYIHDLKFSEPVCCPAPGALVLQVIETRATNPRDDYLSIIVATVHGGTVAMDAPFETTYAINQGRAPVLFTYDDVLFP